MSTQMREFHFNSFAQEIIFGAGSLNRLSEALDRLQLKRLMVCASSSVRLNGWVSMLENLLGERLVAIFDRVQPHVQDKEVAKALELASNNNVDAIIGFGGGSPIGMAKAVAFALEKKLIIAIPTTYAGSEMTSVYGITHTNETPPRKVTINDPKIAPKLVIYDPELTLNLSAEMTTSTGINALAHCIEALYSKTRNPLSTSAAIQGVQHIQSTLLNCYRDGHNLEARTEMLLGSHLAGLSLASVSMGLHHGLCHVLGGSANIPHGIANSIILPHVILFNAEVTAPQLLPAAEAMGISLNSTSPTVSIEALSQKIFDLIDQMNLPQRLRDVGVGESDLSVLAGLAFQNRAVQNNPKPITDAAQLENLLREAW